MELTNKIINSFLALSAAAALGAGGMYLYHRDAIKNGTDNRLISESEKILAENGLEFPDSITKEEAALKGYISAYNDRYTYYADGDDVEGYVAAINAFSSLVASGYTVGVGDGGSLVVTSVKSGSPAEKQGMMTGDVILAVDSVSVAVDGIKKTAWELPGEDGTTMHLSVKRDGVPREFDFVRANDPDLEVSNIILEPHGKILSVRIKSFDMFTPAELAGELEEYDKDYSKIVLDLRNNFGGLTDGALGSADMFLKEGDVTSYYANGDVTTDSLNDGENELEMPMVVLVNENTASAAEIMTALLKQYGGDVTIVGENTFGKGVFQLEEELSNGGILHYTAGYYTVGDWECYQGKGIAPDVEVEMDSSLIGTDDDVQMKKALDILS